MFCVQSFYTGKKKQRRDFPLVQIPAFDKQQRKLNIIKFLRRLGLDESVRDRDRDRDRINDTNQFDF